MEVDAGGGGDKRWERGWDPTDPGREAKRQKPDQVKDFTNVRKLKALVGPFQKHLSEIEAQADGPEEKRTQVFAALKGRDVKMSAVEPCFWSRVFTLSPSMKDILLSADRQMFMEITNFLVKEDESTISFQFEFKENKYFENRTLDKAYPLLDGTAKVKGDKVLWKADMNPAGWLNRLTSFFEWFSDGTSFHHDTIAKELVKLYRNPLQDVQSDEEDWVGSGSEVSP